MSSGTASDQQTPPSRNDSSYFTVAQIAARPMPKEATAPDPWFEWTQAPWSSPWIMVFILKLAMAIPTLYLLWFVGPITALLDDLTIRHAHAAAAAFVVIALGTWLGMGINAAYYFRVHRMTARVRTVVFGPFSSTGAHLATTFVCVVIVLLLCAWWPASWFLPEYVPFYRSDTWWESLVLIVARLDLSTSVVWTLGLVFAITVGALLLDALVYLMESAEIPAFEMIDSAEMPTPPPRSKAIVAHLTDLHLLDTEESVLMENGKPGGNIPLRRLLDAHTSLLSEDTTAMVITGDITDTGSRAQWEQFFTIVKNSGGGSGEGLIKKTALVPGNHDINIPSTARSYLWRGDARVMQLRFMLAADRVHGDRAHIRPDSSEELVSFHDLMMRISPDIHSFIALSNHQGPGALTEQQKDELVRSTKVIDSLWEEMFPMAVTITGSDLVVFIVNSIDPASTALTNAFGRLGSVQGTKLERLRALFPDKPHLIALHHHVSQRITDRAGGLTLKDRVKLGGMALHDGRALLANLAARPALVLNGHRHRRYRARVAGGAIIVSGASTTLGDEASTTEQSPEFQSHYLDWDEKGVITSLGEVPRKLESPCYPSPKGVGPSIQTG